MASYKRHHSILIQDEILLLKDQIRRDMFDGAENGTRIRIKSISGMIDPYTEEITYFTSYQNFNASGIIGTVNEHDVLYSIAGRVKVGDLVITYPFDAVSGVYLNNVLDAILLSTPMASGLYFVSEKRVETLADTPIFLKVGLTLDQNG